MAKYAYVLTKWIGIGTEEDPQRPDMPEGYTRCEDVTGQYVHLAKGSPDPNVVVVKIEESREKHKGYIDSLRLKKKQVLLETWEDDEKGGVTPIARVAAPTKVDTYLTAAGVSAVVADEVANTIPDVSLGEKLARVARTFGKARVPQPLEEPVLVEPKE